MRTLLFNFLVVNQHLIMLIFYVGLLLFLSYLIIYWGIDILYILLRREKASFNLWVDRIIPCLLLVSPYGLVVTIMEGTILEKCWIIIFSHLLNTVLLRYLSNLRGWDIINNTFHSWKHPRLYFHIHLAFLYPLLFFGYLLIFRYIRLGSVLDLSVIFPESEIVYCLSLFLVTYWLAWVYLVILSFQDLRKRLWYYTSTLGFSLHITLLRYNCYFKVLRPLYKILYIVNNYLILLENDGRDKEKFPYWRQGVRYLYFHPSLFPLTLFFFLVLELLTKNGHLYYGLYGLFWYPIIAAIVWLFYTFVWSNFVQHSCLNDYLCKNWEAPKFPEAFWYFFQDPEWFYNFQWTFSPEEETYVANLAKQHAWHLRKKTTIDLHYWQLMERCQNKSYVIRTAAAFRSIHYGARWVHTTTNGQRPLHSGLGFVVRGFFEHLALINSSWSNYNAILRNIKLNKIDFKLPDNFYVPHPNVNIYPARNFPEFLENNLVTNFQIWAENGVILEPYLNQKLSFYVQACPDLVANFAASFYEFKGIVGLDQKTNPGKGLFKILSQTTSLRYKNMLRMLAQDMENKGIASDATRIHLKKLINSCENLTEHTQIWAQGAHFYPYTYMPPIRVAENFCTQLLTDEAKVELVKAMERLLWLSDEFYRHKIPPLHEYQFSEGILTLAKSIVAYIPENLH